MDNKKNALIIGCGQMGAFYDKPNSKYCQTYAHAFKQSEWINSIGFVDADASKAMQAAEIWGGIKYETLDEALVANCDFCVIAVPDCMHAEVFRMVCEKSSIKLIILEKPVAGSLNDALTIETLSKKHDIQVVVNYSRSFLPELKFLKKEIHKKTFGNLLFGAACYGKGLLHNGSHMLNLIEMLVGDIEEMEPQKAIYDYSEPSIEGTLLLGSGAKININCVPATDYSIFELELTFDSGKIKLLDSTRTIETWYPKPSEIYSDYKYLELEATIFTDLDKSLLYLMNNIESIIYDGATPNCTLDEGIHVVKIWNNVMEKLKEISY